MRRHTENGRITNKNILRTLQQTQEVCDIFFVLAVTTQTRALTEAAEGVQGAWESTGPTL